MFWFKSNVVGLNWGDGRHVNIYCIKASARLIYLPFIALLDQYGYNDDIPVNIYYIKALAHQIYVPSWRYVALAHSYSQFCCPCLNLASLHGSLCMRSLPLGLRRRRAAAKLTWMGAPSSTFLFLLAAASSSGSPSCVFGLTLVTNFRSRCYPCYSLPLHTRLVRVVASTTTARDGGRPARCCPGHHWWPHRRGSWLRLQKRRRRCRQRPPQWRPASPRYSLYRSWPTWPSWPQSQSCAVLLDIP